MPIDKKYMSRHVTGNTNGMIPVNNNKSITNMTKKLKRLKTGSISMIDTNVEWKHFQYRETTNDLLRKICGGARV
jgi:hypothetical protein